MCMTGPLPWTTGRPNTVKHLSVSVCQHRRVVHEQSPPLNGLFSSGKLWRLEDVIAKLNVNYGSNLVINFFIGIDDKDSSSHIIHVGLGLWWVGNCLFSLSGECLLDALNNRQSSNLVSAV